MTANIICVDYRKFERRCPYTTASRLKETLEQRCRVRKEMIELSAVVKQGAHIAQMVNLRTAAKFFAMNGVPIEIAIRVLSGNCRESDRLA